MLNFQNAASDITGLEYDNSFASCSTFSSTLPNIIFVPLASNAKFEINETKIEIVSEDKYDNGKIHSRRTSQNS